MSGDAHERLISQHLAKALVPDGQFSAPDGVLIEQLTRAMANLATARAEDARTALYVMQERLLP